MSAAGVALSASAAETAAPPRSASAERESTAFAGLLPEGGRFVPFADMAGVTTQPGRRKAWTIDLRAGGTLTLRPALDADELQGGWAAWDEAVAFLAGTR